MTSSATDVSGPLPEMPLLPITSEVTVEACKNYLKKKKKNHNDATKATTVVYVCSYPKSGTTWTQNLVCRLLAAHLNQDLSADWHLSHSAPFYEVDQYWNHDNHDGASRVPPQTPLVVPGVGSFEVFNTHLRPHQLPLCHDDTRSHDQQPQGSLSQSATTTTAAKYIYVMREPLDVLASFYYHLANMSIQDGGYAGSPQDFCQDFFNGKVFYGKWQDHMEAWLGNNNTGTTVSDEDVLLLQYEDMKTNLTNEATKVAKFLFGNDYEPGRLEKVVTSAVSHSTFEAMRNERWRYTPQSVAWKEDDETGKPYENFVRAGRIGDGKLFLETHGTQELQQQWKECLALARKRWARADIDEDIIRRYLGSDE